jgi:phosphatidylglycerophosphate synthase
MAVLVMYAIAVATDFLDGRVARHHGTASSRGQLFDHATDVLFVGASLVVFASSGRISWWVPAAVIGAVAAYAHAVWRDGRVGTDGRGGAGAGGARSAVGHAAGVLNYILVGILAVDVAIPALVPGWLLGTTATTVVAANTLAVAGRIVSGRPGVRLADQRPRV